MSQPAIARELGELESVSIRGHLSIEDLVRRQIDRCNVSMSGADQSIFEANVRALMTMLPSHKLSEVMKRKDEYNVKIDDWRYEENCGARMGTPSTPITSDGRPAKEDWSNVISPVPVSYTQTDYEKLYEIIMQGYESLNLTWRVDPKVAEFGKPIVQTFPVPADVLKQATKAVVDVLLKSRASMIEKAKLLETRADRRKAVEKANQFGFAVIVEAMREVMPSTPVYETHHEVQ